jgi:thiamine biosynthesis lipoprotein
MGGALILALAALTGVGLWKTLPGGSPGRTAYVRHPQRIMGTSCTLVAVAETRNEARVVGSLDAAEAVLREVEGDLSTWLEESEISRLNVAEVNTEVPLSPGSVEVLRAAREAFAQTAGAFDVTCRPLIELWKEAGTRGRLPADPELAGSRAASNWDLLDLTGAGVIKRDARVRVDLGGIAKGYGVDRAAEELRCAGAVGGLVDVGGDLICIGLPPDGRYWAVEVKNPFGGDPLGQLQLRDRAVCTSGNYARFTTIAGQRYSHIIDPRTGRPVEGIPSVTVVAHSAMEADIWATALSVLGPDGFDRLPNGIEALMVVGTEDDYEIICTHGLVEVLEGELPEGLRIWMADQAR